MDIMTSSITSIEGYDYALIITDDTSMYRWAYGLKTINEANAMVRKWIADIADVRDRHKMEVLIRDNASELKSKDLTAHLESLGFKKYYSAAYEQWQNGLAESLIKSLNLLVRLQMVESGMTGMFWFRALRTAKDARNATYHERIKTHMLAYRSTVNPRTFPSFGRLDAVHS
jgi:transposase InsO family protein